MPFFSNLLSLEFRLSGFPWLLRHTLQKKKTTILIFHQPQTAFLDRALTALKKRYNIIPFSQFLRSQNDKTTVLPKRPLVITFDDGWANNYDLLPLLEKHQAPATIFLIAGIADTSHHPWFYVVKERAFKESLKKMSDPVRMAALKRIGFEENQNFEERILLNREEITAMQNSGLVEFGSHTLTHPILPGCSDSKAAKEIQLSKEKTEALTGKPCTIFSFPNGEYSERDIRICKKAGYEAAVTLDAGFNAQNNDPFKLKRISVPDNGNISELLVKASGTWALFKVLSGRQKRTRRHSGL
ncbi:polysaccharide deacetylase family protein [Marinilabilia sp.]|uniref:polysaccharide deacetylase family protein n=1 Tax=Marinilabilia sp. TaxID=2021252 RepID=UPI0025BC6659|nr:polysaccharide deacetylase family protein [Marinilabilia sp.]